MAWTYTDVTGLTYQTLLSVVQAEIICAINERMDAIGQDMIEFKCGDGTATCTLPDPIDFDGFPILGETHHASEPLRQNMALIRSTLLNFPGLNENGGVTNALFRFVTESGGTEHETSATIQAATGKTISNETETFANAAWWNAVIAYIPYLRYVHITINTYALTYSRTICGSDWYDTDVIYPTNQAQTVTAWAHREDFTDEDDIIPPPYIGWTIGSRYVVSPGQWRCSVGRVCNTTIGALGFSGTKISQIVQCHCWNATTDSLSILDPVATINEVDFTGAGEGVGGHGTSYDMDHIELKLNQSVTVSMTLKDEPEDSPLYVLGGFPPEGPPTSNSASVAFSRAEIFADLNSALEYT